ncbi:MAG TPA: S24 family peptidase [Thiolinea sp.]|nr:S24 family peptidase [Thiolinea sp.]
MNETRVAVAELFKPRIEDSIRNNLADGGSCAEAEPFALQVTDDSMEPEFATGCIIIIDPGTVVRDGSFVFARDRKDGYIFRRLRILDGRYFLEPLNDLYETFEISGPDRIEGVITQRAGKRRSYHKWYDQ